LIGELTSHLRLCRYCGAVAGRVSSDEITGARWHYIAAGVVVGILIGLINGFFVAVSCAIPSFIVTLAGLN